MWSKNKQTFEKKIDASRNWKKDKNKLIFIIINKLKNLKFLLNKNMFSNII